MKIEGDAFLLFWKLKREKEYNGLRSGDRKKCFFLTNQPDNVKYFGDEDNIVIKTEIGHKKLTMFLI